MLLAAVSLSCHTKERGYEPGVELAPPYGLVFTQEEEVGTRVTYFNLSTMRPVYSEVVGNFLVMACVTNQHGNKLAVADGQEDRVAILQLPGMLETFDAYFSGRLVDLAVDTDIGHIYAITHNGDFWIDSVAIERFDTLEVALFPRRLTLRPPGRTEAWVVCVGNNTLHVIDLRRGQMLTTETFNDAPTDVGFSPDGSKAYVAFVGGGSSVTCYNADSLLPITTYGTGGGPFELAVSDDGELLAASDSLRGTVQVWDLDNTSTWIVPIGARASSLYFAKQSHSLYVLAQGVNRVKRVQIGDHGPTSVDSLQFNHDVENMILWENRD